MREDKINVVGKRSSISIPTLRARKLIGQTISPL